jgi:hypothetical protein
MSKVMYEISVVVGKYTNKEGQEKSRYLKIGSVIDTKNGPMLKMDCTPNVEGGWNGWAYMNPPREEDKSDKPRRNREQNDMDVPF